jgi:hypothetical protein
MQSCRNILVVLVLYLFTLAGCGSVECSFVAVNVTPQSGAADHNSGPPENLQHFDSWGAVSQGCVTPASNLLNVTWSVSDTVNASISNTRDATFGTATCLNSTSDAVTVTATLPASANHGRERRGTAILYCQ